MRLLITGGSGFIGTNAIELFLSKGHSVSNYSTDPPLNPRQQSFWIQGDIMDANLTSSTIQKLQPDWLLHLAARAECDETTTVEKGYAVNIQGTQNVLDAIRATPSIKRSIITSSQFVCGPARLPANELDYFPETVYGESKVITEKLTRAANLDRCWTIVRPTNIWGPWHNRYRREFWRVVKKGLYVHPGRAPVIRCYGYVKNVVHQMLRIFEAPVEAVNRKTIYLGDPPTDLFAWTNGFSKALRGRPVRVVPRWMLRFLALLGDIPTALTGRPFLINSSRYRSMTTNYTTPMEDTFRLLGENPYSLDEGIAQTVDWLRTSTDSGREAGGS